MTITLPSGPTTLKFFPYSAWIFASERCLVKRSGMYFLSSNVPSASVCGRSGPGTRTRTMRYRITRGGTTRHSTVAASAYENVIDTTSVKSGLAGCESSLFAALLCGTAAALGVVSALSLIAGLRVDACKCAQGTRTLVLLRPGSRTASAIKTLGTKLNNCVLVQPDGWAPGEREGYGGARDVIA